MGVRGKWFKEVVKMFKTVESAEILPNPMLMTDHDFPFEVSFSNVHYEQAQIIVDACT